MNIARWRLVLIASLLVVLGAVGGGLVEAVGPVQPFSMSVPGSGAQTTSSEGGARVDTPASVAANGSDGSADLIDLALKRGGLGPVLARRLWDKAQRLVHGEVTLDLPNKGLTTFAVDHGTIAAVDGSALTIRLKGDRTVTVRTNGETKIRKGGDAAELGALKSGDDAFVISVREGSDFIARRVIVRAK